MKFIKLFEGKELSESEINKFGNKLKRELNCSNKKKHYFFDWQYAEYTDYHITQEFFWNMIDNNSIYQIMDFMKNNEGNYSMKLVAGQHDDADIKQIMLEIVVFKELF